MSGGGPFYFRLNLYHRILHGMVIASFTYGPLQAKR